ncbi:MAG TPA: hypothetical protein ENI80_07440 [Acidiferrobacteraceae bacterium]|nr:hypothetical protein [Acidiferrobacteraceae bacterium]
MTSLRVALLIVGLVFVVIIGLISYDKLRMRRIDIRRMQLRKRAKEWQEPALVVRHPVEDEPTLPADDDQALLAAEITEEPKVRDPHEAGLDDIEHAATMPLDLDPGLPQQLREQRADEVVDFVARVQGETIVPRDTVLGIYKQNEYLLDKHRCIYGLNEDNGLWRDLEQEPENGQYTDIELAIQLADRDGPVSESELNKFAQMGLRIADMLVRPIKFSMSFEAALERAGDLDNFCRTYDVLAIINMVSRGEERFAGPGIDRLAKECGMQLGNMNIYHKINTQTQGGRYLYSIANMYKPGDFDPNNLEGFQTKGLTFFLNIPTAFDPPKVYADMIHTVKTFSDRFGGVLLDRDRHTLDDATLERIGQHVDRIAKEMDKEGVVPGGEAALRLF